MSYHGFLITLYLCQINAHLHNALLACRAAQLSTDHLLTSNIFHPGKTWNISRDSQKLPQHLVRKERETISGKQELCQVLYFYFTILTYNVVIYYKFTITVGTYNMYIVFHIHFNLSNTLQLKFFTPEILTYKSTIVVKMLFTLFCLT